MTRFCCCPPRRFSPSSARRRDSPITCVTCCRRFRSPSWRWAGWRSSPRGRSLAPPWRRSGAGRCGARWLSFRTRFRTSTRSSADRKTEIATWSTATSIGVRTCCSCGPGSPSMAGGGRSGSPTSAAWIHAWRESLTSSLRRATRDLVRGCSPSASTSSTEWSIESRMAAPACKCRSVERTNTFESCSRSPSWADPSASSTSHRPRPSACGKSSRKEQWHQCGTAEDARSEATVSVGRCSARSLSVSQPLNQIQNLRRAIDGVEHVVAAAFAGHESDGAGPEQTVQ